MSLLYRLMYRVGFTPWDDGRVSAALKEVVEGHDALAPARALDIGSGTGTQSVYLARRGWDVTGLDAVPRALDAARAKAAAKGVSVDWRRADITKPADLGLESGFGLFFDRGCFHGLNGGERSGYVESVSSLAAPGALLLLMSFAPAGRVGPVGADEAEIVTRFEDGWELLSSTPDTDPAPPGPLRNVARTWYRLRYSPRSASSSSG